MKYAPGLMYGDDIETFASASRWMDWEGNVFLPHQHTLVMHLVRLPPRNGTRRRSRARGRRC